MAQISTADMIQVASLWSDDDDHPCDRCEFRPWCDVAYAAEAAGCDMAGLDADWLEDEAYARENFERRQTLGAM